MEEEEEEEGGCEGVWPGLVNLSQPVWHDSYPNNHSKLATESLLLGDWSGGEGG